MDRKTYNEYKSIVSEQGIKVKEDLISHIKNMIKYETPNIDTLNTIAETQSHAANPPEKTCSSFAEMPEDMRNGI